MLARTIQRTNFSRGKRSSGVLIIFIIVALLFLFSASSSSFSEHFSKTNTQAQVAKP